MILGKIKQLTLTWLKRGWCHCMGIKARTNFTSYCTVESKHLHEWCMKIYKIYKHIYNLAQSFFLSKGKESF